MATKTNPKNKKLVKVRDLNSRKDAKGGQRSQSGRAGAKGNLRGWGNHNETLLIG